MNREIRSYVLRQGRVTPAQQRAYAELLPRHGIAYSPAAVDARAVFGRDAPLVLEIGSGMGETTAAIALANPDKDYIAVEVHLPGVGALLKRIEAEGIANLRVIRHDALEVLERMIADGALAAIHLFFPDPWPKKRHHKRRIVQAPFAALAARKLAPGGLLHAATDWAEYAEQMQAVFDAEPLLMRVDDAGQRPTTKFERRGLKLGHAVRDLVYRRR
ncbi:MAG: tRNA (guanosine(46)-N7)-methyltransferase TrmB [Burkholderiales bacterium]